MAKVKESIGERRITFSIKTTLKSMGVKSIIGTESDWMQPGDIPHVADRGWMRKVELYLSATMVLSVWKG